MTDFNPLVLKGVFSAMFTPYDKEGRVNVAMIEQIVEFHLQAGLAGFYVTGSTGESFLLSESERKLVVESVVKFNRGRGKIIAHVGHISTDTAVELARHAAQCGVDALSAVGPVYFGPTFDHAYRHYHDIAGAADLPFIIYSLGRDLVPDQDVKFFNIKNAVGMKYTGMNFFAMQQLMKKIDKPHIFFSGADELFLAALPFGVSGSIGTSQNFAPSHFATIYRLFNEGKIEEARKIQSEINNVIEVMLIDSERSYQKAVMRYVGFDSGNFRKPFKPLTEAEYQDFAKKLEKLNVLRPGK
jgi:N-acetylneuraminate lyase